MFELFSLWALIMLLTTFLYRFPSTHMQDICEAIKLRVKMYLQEIATLSDKAKLFSRMVVPIPQKAEHSNQRQA